MAHDELEFPPSARLRMLGSAQATPGLEVCESYVLDIAHAKTPDTLIRVKLPLTKCVVGYSRTEIDNLTSRPDMHHVL